MTEAGGVGKTKITSEDVHGCHVHVTTCFLYSITEVFVPLPAGIAEGWMIWSDVARDSTCGNKTWQKSWDRAEMAQTGQNYHYFLKRAENQNDQNLMVVWWYRIILYIYVYTHSIPTNMQLKCKWVCSFQLLVGWYVNPQKMARTPPAFSISKLGCPVNTRLLRALPAKNQGSIQAPSNGDV